MIPLSEIDIERVRMVHDGDLVGRGAGKTIEKMLTMLSYAQPRYDNMKILFVGENYNHVRDIHRCFWQWLKECDIQTTKLENSLVIRAIFKPLIDEPHGIIGWAVPTFWELFTAHRKHPPNPPAVSFYFGTPRSVDANTRFYNNVIIDLTEQAYYDNYAAIYNILMREKQW